MAIAGGVGGRLQGWFGEQHLAAWIVSGVGLVLAGLSLWYLIIVKALHIGTAMDGGLLPLVLKIIEVALLAGFSLVLVYAGYWLASSPFEKRRLWWAGLWTMIGLTGVVAIVALTVSMQVANGEPIHEPTLVQEMLLAAGGGALAGLLIGVSTIRETVEGEQAKQQRTTLLFVNELLRHNVLNGMQVVLGNTERLREHTDEEGQPLLDRNEARAESVVELIENVRALMQSVSGETSLTAVPLDRVLHEEVSTARSTYPEATIETDVPSDVTVHADELLAAVFENLLANAVQHTDTDEPHVEVTVEERPESVVVAVADDGPGMPVADRERFFESGERGTGSEGMGLGLYLVETLVGRYGGAVRVADNEPRGIVVEVELPYPDSSALG